MWVIYIIIDIENINMKKKYSYLGISITDQE